MHNIDHPNIVRFFGVVLPNVEGSLMLVTELAPLRSLLECLKEPSLRSSFPVLTLCDFAYQICDGMQYLEANRLIHRYGVICIHFLNLNLVIFCNQLVINIYFPFFPINNQFTFSFIFVCKVKELINDFFLRIIQMICADRNIYNYINKTIDQIK